MKTLITTLLFGAVLSAQNYYEYKAKEDGSLNGFELTDEVYMEVLKTFNRPTNTITLISTNTEELSIIKKEGYIIIKQRYLASNEVFTTQPIKKEEW